MILITGGAGYIGSHVNKKLNQEGFETVIFDNFSNGHRELAKWGTVIEGDLDNIEDIEKVFETYDIEAVAHLVAFIEVGESVKDPQKFYYNNLVNTLNLLSVMRKHNVNKIIFSSTAAVFGVPQYVPIDEKHPLDPLNAYGKTKMMIENVFKDYDLAYGLKSIVFRYFNAAGADPDGETGEWHVPESHLIPIVFEVATGIRSELKINGNDFPTEDGTCVRDYVHVTDLAAAHVLGLKKLLSGGESATYNLGYGKGFSNKQVVETIKKVTNKDFPVVIGDRRPGDSPVLVAASDKIKAELGWKPEFDNLERIIETAWKWYQNKPKG
ncbi:MAG: UDP-glucose 4-epimerase GalE [Candidatus Shapirobacteria bacterium]